MALTRDFNYSSDPLATHTVQTGLLIFVVTVSCHSSRDPPPHLTLLPSFYTCVNVTDDTSHLPLPSPHPFSHHLILITWTSHSRAATPSFALLGCSFSAHLLPPTLSPHSLHTCTVSLLFFFRSVFKDCCQRDSRFRNGSEAFWGGGVLPGP